MKAIEVAGIYRYFDQVADALELSIPERLKLVGGMSPTTYLRHLNGQSSTFQPEDAKRLGLFFTIYQEVGHMGDAKDWLLRVPSMIVEAGRLGLSNGPT